MTNLVETTANWGRFARVPKGAAADLRLTNGQLRVLVAIGEYVDRHGVAWPSVATLAKAAGVCRRTVQRALRRLAELGYLTIQMGGFRRRRASPSVYTLVFRPVAKVEGVPQETPPSVTGDAQTIPANNPSSVSKGINIRENQNWPDPFDDDEDLIHR